MATIAKLVIQMTADPTGVQAGVAKAAESMRNLSQTVAATAQDFARAGATTAQIVQLTGVSLQTARNAVQVYGGTLATTQSQVLGFAAAQREMAIAGLGAASANNTATASFSTAGAGLGRLRMGVTSAIASMTGMPPILARIASTMGVMGVGTNAALGALAAVAAGVVVWKAWHDEASKAAEEQEKLTGDLIKWYDAQKNGGTDAFLKQIGATTASLRTLHTTLDGVMTSKFFSGVGVVGEGGSAWKAWLRIFTAGDPAAVATQFRIEMAKGTATIVKGIAEDSAAIRAAGRQAFLDAQTATQSALTTRTGDLSTVIGAGRGTTGQIGEASSMLRQYNGLLRDLQRAYGGIADAELKAFNLSQQASAIANIKTLTAALKGPKLDLKPVQDLIAAEKELAATRQLNTPIGITLVEKLVQEHSRLLDQLQEIEKTDPFGEMATSLRSVVKGLDDAITGVAKFRHEQETLARIIGRVPGVAAPIPAALGHPEIADVGLQGFTQPAREIADALEQAGDKLREFAGSTFFAVFRSIGGQLSPLSQIISALNQAAAPLVPVMTKLANIVASTLGPVFTAFAPVLESLLPLFDGIFRVLAPILTALAPLFQALVPLLTALFPIIKLVAIQFTYVAQAGAFLAGILFNIAGGIAVAIGGLIAAIGTIISHIPFLGGVGRDIRDFGNTIKDLGKGFESTANGLFQTADDMQKARDAINGITIDPAQTAIDALGTAASAAAGALLNVPTGYKVALARFNATAPITPPPLTPTIPTLTPTNPNGSTLPLPGSSGSEEGGASGATFNFNLGTISIVGGGNKSAGELVDDLLTELKRRARAQLGDERLWSQVMV